MKLNRRTQFKVISVTFVLALILSYNNCNKVNFTASGTNLNGLNNITGIPNTPPINFNSTNCTIGYPFMSSNLATNVAFNESPVMVAFTPGGIVSLGVGNSIAIWYSDEKAMTLGVRQVNVVTSAGTTTTDYPVSALPSNPGVQTLPQVGASVANGGVDASRCPGSTTAQDACSRPLFPALFVTDTTSNAASLAGDWQSNGMVFPPTAVFGTWKAAVKTIDMTASPPSVAITVDSDPVRNNWNLGAGVPVPTSLPPGVETGFSAMVSWDVSTLGLQSGHSYRIQFMVHDGDQNKTGGDVGENCVNLQVP